jgi:hypothetical protein
VQLRNPVDMKKVTETRAGRRPKREKISIREPPKNALCFKGLQLGDERSLVAGWSIRSIAGRAAEIL